MVIFPIYLQGFIQVQVDFFYQQYHSHLLPIRQPGTTHVSSMYSLPKLVGGMLVDHLPKSRNRFETTKKIRIHDYSWFNRRWDVSKTIFVSRGLGRHSPLEKEYELYPVSLTFTICYSLYNWCDECFHINSKHAHQL